MKRVLSTLLTAILLLTSCSFPTKTPTAVLSLPPSFEMTGRLYYKDVECTVKYHRFSDGLSGLTFESPGSLKGVSLSLSHEGKDIRLGNQVVPINGASFPQKSAFSTFNSLFSTLVETQLALSKQGDFWIGEGSLPEIGSFTVESMDGKTLSKFSVSAEGLVFVPLETSFFDESEFS